VKKVSVLLLSVVMLSLQGAGEQGGKGIATMDLSPVVRKVKPAMVRVMHLSPVGGAGGSGSIVSPDGYIYTNWHVVTSSKLVDITLDNGEVIPGKVVGTNVKVDFGLVKLIPPEPRIFPYVDLADSDKIQKNDLVFAIGSPGDASLGFLIEQFNPGFRLKEFQLVNTVTVGIVKDFTYPFPVTEAEDIYNPDYGKEITWIIQTTATINSGNSGGATFNVRGEQIGINSWGSSMVEAANLFYPINDAKKSAEDILKYGRVIYPWAGLYIFWAPQDRNPTRIGGWPGGEIGFNPQQDIQRYIKEGILGFDEFYKKMKYPVKVKGVFPGSPAERVGLAEGDVIYSVNGKTYKDAFELRKMIRSLSVGDRVEFYIQRGGAFRLVTLELEEQPQPPAGAGGTI